MLLFLILAGLVSSAAALLILLSAARAALSRMSRAAALETSPARIRNSSIAAALAHKRRERQGNA